MIRRLALLSLSACLLTSCASLSSAGENSPWERVFFSPLSARALVFTDSCVLYATSAGIYRSEDGERFRRSDADLPGDPEVVAVAAAPRVREVYAVTDVGYLLRSDDDGRTFRAIGQFPHVRVTSLAMNRNGRLFVGTSTGVLMTDQDLAGVEGRRIRSYLMPWEMLVLGLPIWRRANLGTDTDLWKEWSVVFDGSILRIAADPERPEHVIADVFERGAFETRDEGESWKPLAAVNGDTIKGPIAFGSDRRILVGLHLSRDGGGTWRKTGLEPDRDDLRQSGDVAFPAHSAAFTPEGLWALHYRAASVYFSPDGVSWRREGDPEDFTARDRETSPALLATDRLGRLWVATEGHGLYRRSPLSDVEKNSGTR